MFIAYVLLPGLSSLSKLSVMEHQGFLVAVHVGAGNHSAKKEDNYKKTMSLACNASAAALQQRKGALSSCCDAIKHLEDDPITNAGVGSNLTFEGFVQCDASIMSGDGLFGAVGAVHGVRHPVQAAYLLANESCEPMTCGRVRPIMLVSDSHLSPDEMLSMLVSEGARRYAESRGLEVAANDQDPQYQVTDVARQAWRKYRAMVELADTQRAQQQEEILNCCGPDSHNHDNPPSQQQEEIPNCRGPDSHNHGNPPSQLQEEIPNCCGPDSHNHDNPPSQLQEEIPNCRGPDSHNHGNPPSQLQREFAHKPKAQIRVQDARSDGCQPRLNVGGLDVSLVPESPTALRGSESIPDSLDTTSLVHDTVGSVVVDAWGRTAAGVSSGGIALKRDGRVGEAAMFACGCWAQDLCLEDDERTEALMRPPACITKQAAGASRRVSAPCYNMRDHPNTHGSEEVTAHCEGYPAQGEELVKTVGAEGLPGARVSGVAVSVTGVGEAMIRGLVAKECGVQLLSRVDDPVDQVLAEILRAQGSGNVYPSCCSSSEPSDGGILAVRVKLGNGRVWCEVAAAHTSPSMGIGYQSSISSNAARKETHTSWDGHSDENESSGQTVGPLDTKNDQPLAGSIRDLEGTDDRDADAGTSIRDLEGTDDRDADAGTSIRDLEGTDDRDADAGTSIRDLEGTDDRDADAGTSIRDLEGTDDRDADAGTSIRDLEGTDDRDADAGTSIRDLEGTDDIG
ncbi:hypothetical protein CEUSTIGMA_g8543.t1 [Chlamydomonas eustigma]|uniref:Uncharacterized protein n=1 Tax=Chlamydomonas eustigma TaxID=1157962 RepID=A0A250XDX3_9CHLO|nr:hypothetical protein CEUSTIGMA_g8543.t1 [Chlamydomonas eustigma]|eukprot:GAX81109.1 hypothetical protein CEUSTIGMA_g8543.t1 [Chlamydomonas eustigma]